MVNTRLTARGNAPRDTQYRLLTLLSQFKVVPLITRFIQCEQADDEAAQIKGAALPQEDRRNMKSA